MREGIIAIQCGAFHLSRGRQEVLQHHAARPRRDHDRHRARHARGRRARLRRRQHAQGQRHPALLPLRHPGRPGAASIYKPWLDHAFVDGVRRPQGDERVPRATSACPTRWAPRRPTRTDANVLGATHEAKDLEHLDKGMRIVEPIMGVALWKPEVADRAGGGHGRLRAGPAGRAQRPALRLARSSCSSRPTASAAATASGMSDQIENRVIDAKSRGIYEAPGMALLHIAYERLLSAIHNENTLDLYFTLGPPARPPALRGQVVRPRGAACSRTRSRAGSRPRSPAR